MPNIILHSVFLLVCLAVMPGIALSAASVTKQSADPLPERCRVTTPERGECKAIFEVYSFNPETNACEVANYGGCGGVVPFATEEECRKNCEIGEQLRLTDVKADARLPYILVSIAYPRNWGDPQFTISVNGTEVQSRWQGGGASGKTSMHTFAVFSGESGMKNIEITTTINGFRHRVSTKHYINAPEMAVLLDTIGDSEAIFENAPLRFFLHQADGPIILLNGKPATASVDRSARGTVITVKPEWMPGMNRVVLEAKGRSGNSFKKEFSFVYLADAQRSAAPSSTPQFPPASTDFTRFSGIKLSVGDRITLPYGHIGSKSGPFFSVSSTDRILGVRQRDMTTSQIFIIDKDGWLAFDTNYLWEINALQSGKANLEFSVKKHFRGAYELEKVVELTVAPRP